MTAFIRTASGDWSDPAKWNIGAGYPNALTDTANLASYAVVTDVDFTCGAIDLATTGAGLTIPTGKTVTQQGSISIRSGTTFSITGTLQGPVGSISSLVIYTGATYTANAGAEFIRVDFYNAGGAYDLSDLISDCSEANMALNRVRTEGSTAQITIDVDTSLRWLWAYSNSLIVIDPGITISMYTGGEVHNWTGGKFDINGTRAAPVTIKPRVAGDAWYLYLYGGTTGSDIDYLICEGQPWTLGDAADGFIFDRKPQKVSPVHRLPAIDDDIILGRGASRIHYTGSHAAIVEVSGIWAAADKQYERVDAMMDKGSIIGFVGDEVFMPNVRVVDHEYERLTGRLYWPYTITLIEDV